MIYSTLRTTFFQSLICWVTILVIPAAAQNRGWVDDTGDHRTQAQLLTIQSSSIRLKKLNGVEVTVPFDRLSKSDLVFIRKIQNPPLTASHPQLRSFPRNGGSSVALASYESQIETVVSRAAVSKTEAADGPIVYDPEIDGPNLHSQIPKQRSAKDIRRALPQSPHSQLASSSAAMAKHPIPSQLPGSSHADFRQKPLGSPATFAGRNTTQRTPYQDAGSSGELERHQNDSQDAATRQWLDQLLNQQLTINDSDLVQQLQDCLESNNQFIRAKALRVLAKNGATACVGQLIQGINDSSYEVRQVAYELIEFHKLQPAIEPLLKNYTGLEREKIASVLLAFGSKIENQLQPFLKHPSEDVRLTTCSLLAKIGTEECLTDLERLRDDEPNFLVRLQAKEAVKNIAARN